MNTKIILAGGVVLIIVLTILLFVLEPGATPNMSTGMATSSETDLSQRFGASSTTPTPPGGKLKAANFSGRLDEVNTGCFSDGECYVVVDGKHITVLRGWSQDTVGSILGAPSIGDLAGMIGATIEVYARDDSDGTYTLYGSEGFYVKVVESGSGSVPQPPVTSNTCVVGGCSSQLCVDEAEGAVVSTCEYREVYGCYKTATCERQSSGQCGWTPTPALTACVAANQ